MGGHRPFFTYVFIIFAVVLQLHTTLAPAGTANALIDNFALTPAYVLRGRALLGLFLYMFLHADWSHLLANCFALWGVGSVIEPEIGSKYTAIAFYASAFFGGVVHTLLNPSSNLPLVGISGGVFGLLAVLFLLMPFKSTLLLVVPLPSVLVGVLMLSIEVAALIWSKATWIAHDVHLVGFLVGALTAFALDRKKAFRGLLVAVIIAASLYYIGAYFGLI